MVFELNIRHRILITCLQRWLLLACILWTGAQNGWCDDKSAQRTKVGDLIRQLDAATLAERNQAERALVELGPEILPLLPAPELIETPSAREAIKRLRPVLERRAARASSAPAHVTLTGNWTLNQIVTEIRRQTGNHVVLEDQTGVAETPLRVDWNRSLFWEALDDCCQLAKMRWQFVPLTARIELVPQSANAPPELAVHRSGPFRLAISSVEVRPVVGEDQQRIVRASGHLSIEPRLRPLFLTMAASQLQARTNQDETLPPWSPEAKYEFPVADGGRDAALRWDFRLPPDVKFKAISIQGKLSCQIAAATERVVFDQTSQTRGTVRRRGGVSVRLKHVNIEPTENNLLNEEIGIVVSYDHGGPAFESHRSWIFHNAVYLETKDGTRTSYTDFETTQQADGAIAVDYRWHKISAPATQYLFVYEAPTLIIDVPVEINLRGIPVEK